jgi:hypothetical protein
MSAVTTRMLTPEPDSTIDPEQLLYRKVQQLTDGENPMTVSTVWLTPETAQEWIDKALASTVIRQRALRTSQVRRWRNLYVTGRFVHLLPNGPLCVDHEGVSLNGMHRLTALAGLKGRDISAGFWLYKDVPQWMFKFFDTGATRTLKDLFSISGRRSSSQTQTATKLAMRYEEFLAGARPATGWRSWSTVKDEHADVDEFLARRDELQDWYAAAEKVYKNARLLIPAVMVFRFYQGLAWPDGDDKLQAFCESLITGSMLSPQSPVLHLREWARDTYINKDLIQSKRELHLLLLMRAFEQYCQQTRITRQVWAYGHAMTTPYHPGGHDVAVRTVRAALQDMDVSRA